MNVEYDEYHPAGIYGINNNTAVLIYKLDLVENKALALGIGVYPYDREPIWCPITEDTEGKSRRPKLGFMYHRLFVPLDKVYILPKNDKEAHAGERIYC